MESKMNMTTAAVAQPAASARRDTLMGATMAALLGAVIVWGVGFSHIDLLHNAAHDTRHSNGFPCH